MGLTPQARAKRTGREFAQLPREIIESDLDDPCVRLFALCDAEQGKNGRPAAGYRAIADALGWKADKVAKHVEHLRKRGLVAIEREEIRRPLSASSTTAEEVARLHWPFSARRGAGAGRNPHTQRTRARRIRNRVQTPHKRVLGPPMTGCSKRVTGSRKTDPSPGLSGMRRFLHPIFAKSPRTARSSLPLPLTARPMGTTTRPSPISPKGTVTARANDRPFDWQTPSACASWRYTQYPSHSVSSSRIG